MSSAHKDATFRTFAACSYSLLGRSWQKSGNILSANSLDGNIVETTPGGKQVATITADTNPSAPNPGAGALFGLTVSPFNGVVYYVDDIMNTLQTLG